MIAFLATSSRSPAMYGLDEHLPMDLFPLGDRPILHHVVDRLAALGVRRFEFLLSHLPEKIEDYLVDGARWGCSFRFHLVPSGSSAWQMAAAIASDMDEDIVFGRGDRLPHVLFEAPAGPTIYVTGSGEWTGWAILPRGRHHFADLERLTEGSQPSAAFNRISVEQEVSFATAHDLLHGQHALLTANFPASAIGSRPVKPGIWISRNASVHRGASLEAPVYIGPNCKIEAGAHIGPFAVIGEGSIVDEHSSVKNSLVAPGTYIGQGLELDQVIVDRNRLINARIGTALLVSETFLLSGLVRQKQPRLRQRLFSTAAALLLFVLMAPVSGMALLFLWLARKGVFVRETAVCIPADDDPRLWRTCRYLRFRLNSPADAGWWIEFAAEIWPGLFSIVKGDLFLVGVKPRTMSEVERLSSDWKAIYLSSKAGLITEASVIFGRSPTEDELYTAEAYYSATEGLRHDFKLLRLYLLRMLSYDTQIRLGFADDGRLNSNPGERC